MFWCTVRITHYAIAIQCGGTAGQYAGLYNDMQDALDTLFCPCTVLIALYYTVLLTASPGIISIAIAA